MKPKGITLKGHNEGLNIIVNNHAFKDEKQMIYMLKGKMRSSKRFYKNATLILTTQLELVSERSINNIKAFLYNELRVKECVFQDLKEESKKEFAGVNEGDTKFIRRSIRSGQVISYKGNIVIIGDVNPGAEIVALGNVIVMGTIKGTVHAGADGNNSAMVAAINMQPTLVRIGKYATLFSEEEKPKFPEVVRVKNNKIVIEPYIPNKYF